MTVIEAVKQYRLSDFEKSYTNVYGTSINLKYPLDTLAKMEVKDLYINLKTKSAKITVIDF